MPEYYSSIGKPAGAAMQRAARGHLGRSSLATGDSPAVCVSRPRPRATVLNTSGPSLIASCGDMGVPP